MRDLARYAALLLLPLAAACSPAQDAAAPGPQVAPPAAAAAAAAHAGATIELEGASGKGSGYPGTRGLESIASLRGR